MKSIFYGYYPPTPEEYGKLWKDGVIVLDTNVLLELYRLPSSAREELISALESLKERLWIPHQVALEFQRKRITVIATERNSTEEALNSTKKSVEDIKTQIEKLQIDKRGLGLKSKTLLTELENVDKQLQKSITTAHHAQLDISSSDPIRQRIDELFKNRVGTGPTNQEDLDNLVADGEDRYMKQIPPGFADADKGKNPNEATFIFDHIKYERKFGDLILWRQLIQHIKITNKKHVLFITKDNKGDWWWKEKEKTVGPHPELIREINREAGVELFWMYSISTFTEHANKYASAAISKESVAEIKNNEFVDRSMITENLLNLAKTISQNDASLKKLYELNKSTEVTTELDSYKNADKIQKTNRAIREWASTRGLIVENNRAFHPDFFVKNRSSIEGIEIKHDFSIGKILNKKLMHDHLRVGRDLISTGRITSFNLIITLTTESLLYLSLPENLEELRKLLALYINTNPECSVTIGSIVQSEFMVLLTADEYNSFN